jgi:hypothetical protein
MESNIAVTQSYPVSHNELRPPELEVWEPAFERWLRIADAALRGVPSGKEPARAPQF